MNSTSSCWSEGPAYWPVLPLLSNHFDSLVLDSAICEILKVKYVWAISSENREGLNLNTARPPNPKGESTGGSNLLSFFPFYYLILNQFSGLESPTHALRADADPSAQSASATYITLAQEHPYDRHIEIILHLSGEQFKSCLPKYSSCLVLSVIFQIFDCDFHSHNSVTEPHSPLVIIERGRLSFSQYEQLICSRRDFIRCTRKDSEPERKVSESPHCFTTSICL